MQNGQPQSARKISLPRLMVPWIIFGLLWIDDFMEGLDKRGIVLLIVCLGLLIADAYLYLKYR